MFIILQVQIVIRHQWLQCQAGFPRMNVIISGLKHTIYRQIDCGNIR